ncbi:MAG: GGDEF domain-containing protein [Eggerthellaceae bacterium]|jgi:diguanylate cyclase (GGDEF)-like protein|nr:GGDEF domain-containing protein [Eggerthellaceae bacterium]
MGDLYNYISRSAYFDIPTIIASALGIVVTFVYFKAQGRTQRAVLTGEVLLLVQALFGIVSFIGLATGTERGFAVYAVGMLGVELLYALLSFMLFVVAACAMTEGREATPRVMWMYAIPALVVISLLAIPATRATMYTLDPDGTFRYQHMHWLLEALVCWYTGCAMVWEWRYRDRVPRVTHLTMGMTLFLFALYLGEHLFHLHMASFALSVGFAAFVLAMGQIYGERWESRNADLMAAATTDELTGLLNRRGFEEQALKLLSEPGNEEIAMFMADLDDFKIFNDRFGHRAGDAVLQDCARQLRAIFGTDAVIARTGGDEFHVLLKPDMDKLAHAREALQGVHTFSFERHLISYHVSAGYTLHKKAEAGLDELYRQSDLALYRGKIMRDGGVRAYDESMEHDPREQLGFTARDLAQAVPAGMLIRQNGESRRVLFANSRCLDIFGCETMADLVELSAGDYRNLVPQGEMRHIQDTVFNLTPHENAGWAETRVRRKKGDTVRVYAVGHNQNIERFGNMLCVLIFRA